jgi:hypothetical protein
VRFWHGHSTVAGYGTAGRPGQGARALWGICRSARTAAGQGTELGPGNIARRDSYGWRIKPNKWTPVHFARSDLVARSHLLPFLIIPDITTATRARQSRSMMSEDASGNPSSQSRGDLARRTHVAYRSRVGHGNQLMALQAQQLADLTATVAAQGRAQSLEAGQRTAAQGQGREQLRRTAS